MVCDIRVDPPNEVTKNSLLARFGYEWVSTD